MGFILRLKLRLIAQSRTNIPSRGRPLSVAKNQTAAASVTATSTGATQPQPFRNLRRLTCRPARNGRNVQLLEVRRAAACKLFPQLWHTAQLCNRFLPRKDHIAFGGREQP